MWVSSVLICDAPSREPRVQLLQQWFSSFISEYDPALQTEITQDNVERVFTISPLYSPHKEQPAWMRLTSLDGRLTQLLKDCLPELHNKELQLGNGDALHVTQVLMPESPPPFLNSTDIDRFDPLAWVGCINPTLLISTVMQMPLKRRLKLLFHTATTIRNRTPSGFVNSDLLPLPHYVFLNYARRWETFTGSMPPEYLPEFLQDYAHISHYNLRTYAMRGWDWGDIMGFAGYVDYTFAGIRYLPKEYSQDRDYFVRICFLLSAFGYFAGTGRLTSFGMGQTLPIFS